MLFVRYTFFRCTYLTIEGLAPGFLYCDWSRLRGTHTFRQCKVHTYPLIGIWQQRMPTQSVSYRKNNLVRLGQPSICKSAFEFLSQSEVNRKLSSFHTCVEEKNLNNFITFWVFSFAVKMPKAPSFRESSEKEKIDRNMKRRESFKIKVFRSCHLDTCWLEMQLSTSNSFTSSGVCT
jgi:hypothetical protein